MKYNKLVRDKIPEFILGKGANPKTHIADEKEYWNKLRDKLREEVEEFLEAENIEELADILEVLEAIYEFKGFPEKEILEIKQKKKEERGRFEERIILEEA